MEEEIYEQYIRELLGMGTRDRDVHMICDHEEFRKARGSKQAWKQQYYYRCLTVTLARAFINALGQGRNYVTAADVYNQFPHYNFHITFNHICELLGGVYKRGKCYATLTAEDFRHFIQLRNATRTAEELLAKWKQYMLSRKGPQPQGPREDLPAEGIGRKT